MTYGRPARTRATKPSMHGASASCTDSDKKMGEEKFLETKLLKQLRETAYHPDKRYEELISQGYSEEDSEAIVTSETDTYEEYEVAKQKRAEQLLTGSEKTTYFSNGITIDGNNMSEYRDLKKRGYSVVWTGEGKIHFARKVNATPQPMSARDYASSRGQIYANVKNTSQFKESYAYHKKHPSED